MAREAEEVIEDSEIFTDVDSYTGVEVDSTALVEDFSVNNGGWGQVNEEVIVYVHNNGIYNTGFYNGFGYGLGFGFGFYDPFYYNRGFGFGFNRFGFGGFGFNRFGFGFNRFGFGGYGLAYHRGFGYFNPRGRYGVDYFGATRASNFGRRDVLGRTVINRGRSITTNNNSSLSRRSRTTEGRTLTSTEGRRTRSTLS